MNQAALSHTRPDPRRWGRRTSAALLTSVTVLFFWRFFLLDQTLFAGDTALEFLPFRCLLVERLRAGELPLWNPHLFGGTPLLAEAQHQVFYPPNLLLVLLGAPRGMAWLLALHLLWMAAGAYRFARRGAGCAREGAVLAAVVFAFGGVIQSRLANQPYPLAAAWLPWLLIAADQARARGGVSWCLPGVVLALQLATGAPQFAFYSLVLLAAYLLFCPGAGGPGGQEMRRRALLVLVACLTVGLGLAAVQWLPQAELARQADRGVRASYDFATAFSLQFHHLLGSLLLPRLWGGFNGPPLDGYFPGEELAYPGIPALALVCVALADRLSSRLRPGRPAPPEAGRQTGFWLVLALFAVFLALGRNNLLYPALYRWVPGIGLFRAPARWLLLFSFASAMLAGRGMDLCTAALRRSGPGAGGDAIRVGLWASAGLGLAALVLLVSPAGASALAIPPRPFGPWGQMALLLTGAGIFAVPVLLRDPPRALRQCFPMLIVALLAMDLFVLSQEMELQHTLDAGGLDTPTETASILREGAAGDRFWATTEKGPLELWQSPDQGFGVSETQFRGQSAYLNQSLMLSCVATQFRTYGLTGVWGALMPLRRHAVPLFDPSTPDGVRLRWRRLLGVRYYLSMRPLPDFEPVRSQAPFVFRDPGVFPRTFWVGGARPMSGEAALAAITSGSLDPASEVAVEPRPSDAASPDLPPIAVDRSAEPTARQASPPAGSILEYRAEKVRVGIHAPRPGWLVLMDTPYPGWRAYSEGRRLPIYAANWCGRAVPLRAGYHEVEFRFEPGVVRVGLFGSLTTLMVLSGLIVGQLRSRTRGRPGGGLRRPHRVLATTTPP